MGVVLHEVHSGADVLVGTSGHKFEGKSTAGGGDTICAGVVSTIEGAVGSTGGAVIGRAQSRVEGVAGVAVLYEVD